MGDLDKYDHLGAGLNENLLQFYDSAMDDENLIRKELADLEERYENFELIGEGGSKQVFKVLDKVVNRHVAYAKLLDDKEEHFERFLREARLVSLLQHPGIITVLDMGFVAEKPYFTMELKVGDSLGFILKKLNQKNSEYQEKYPLDKLLSIFVRLCEAVSYAHSRGVIHLDLKPDNIQVGEFGEVVVCDWGLGKLLDDREETEETDPMKDTLYKTQTLTGSIKGTPGFMAPEQITKEGVNSKATDIYALGAVLYNLLVLKIPYEGDVDEVLKQTLVGAMPSPCQRKSEISASLSAVAMKALSVNVKDRYREALTLSHEVSSYLSGYATHAENASALKHLYLFYCRHKKFVATVSIGLLIYFVSSLVFVGLLTEQKNTAVSQSEIAREARAKAEESYRLEQLARRDAEQSLRLYEQQKNVTEDYSERILDRCTRFLRKGMFERDVNKKSFLNISRDLRLLSEREPLDLRIQSAKGYMAFVMNHYAEGQKLMTDSGQFGVVVKCIEELHKTVDRKKEYSTAETIELMKIIHRLRKEKGLHHILQLFRYEALKLRDDFPTVVRTVVDIHNKRTVYFKHEAAQGFVEVGQLGREVQLSANNYHFFRNMKIEHLKVIGTPLKEKLLNQLRLRVLDLSAAEIENYDFLTSNFSIKELIVREGQLPKELEVELQKYIKILVPKN
jgi:serine/threonine protein kinase